jgi:hypothetical protein
MATTTYSPTATGESRAAPLFKAAMWLGIVANLALAIPGTFAPNALLSLLKQPPAFETPVWAASSSMLLGLLSLFYIPAAIDPYKYKANALLAMVSRLSGSTFFLLLWPNWYPFVGWFDLTFLVIQAPLLFFTLLHGPPDRARQS